MAAKFRTRSPDGRNPLEMRRKIMSLSMSLHRLHYLSKTSYLWMRKFASKCLFCLAVQTENEDNSLGDNGTHWFVFLIFICQQTNIKDTRSQGASWALTSRPPAWNHGPSTGLHDFVFHAFRALKPCFVACEGRWVKNVTDRGAEEFRSIGLGYGQYIGSGCTRSALARKIIFF